jgi:hypothetical protein
MPQFATKLQSQNGGQGSEENANNLRQGCFRNKIEEFMKRSCEKTAFGCHPGLGGSASEYTSAIVRVPLKTFGK